MDQGLDVYHVHFAVFGLHPSVRLICYFWVWFYRFSFMIMKESFMHQHLILV